MRVLEGYCDSDLSIEGLDNQRHVPLSSPSHKQLSRITVLQLHPHQSARERFRYTSAVCPYQRMPSYQWFCATWLLVARIVIAQFNSTVSFTLTSLDGPVDVDAARSWYGGLPFTVDTDNGYRTSTGRSSGVWGSSFVGTGFEVQGFGLWKYGSGPSDSDDDGNPGAVFAYLCPSDREWQEESLLELTGNVTDDPRLFAASNMPLSAYDLNWVLRADTQLEFHNLTIDIPIRTQA